MEPEYSLPHEGFGSHNGKDIVVLGNVTLRILSEERAAPIVSIKWCPEACPKFWD
jgi:hypothetical protein